MAEGEKAYTETSSASGILYKVPDKDKLYRCCEENCTRTFDEQEFRNHLRKEHNIADEAVLDKKTKEYRITFILDLTKLSQEDAENVLKKLVPDTARNDQQASASGPNKSEGRIQVWYQCCVKGCQTYSYIDKDQFQDHLRKIHVITSEKLLNTLTEKSVQVSEF